MCAWLHYSLYCSLRCSLHCSLHFSSCRSLLVICLVLLMTVLKNIYIVRCIPPIRSPIYFCDLILQKKPSALFEIAEVMPVMTNNYEVSILHSKNILPLLIVCVQCCL